MTEIREFTHIYAPQRKEDGKNAIESAFSRDDLLNHLVIRNENTNRYLVIPRAELSVNMTKNKSSMHEVIFGWAPQKIKFDIDALECDIPANYDILDELKKAVRDEFFASYFVRVEADLSDDDFFVLKSHGGVVKEDKVIQKTSYHVLVAPAKFALLNSNEATEFTNRIKTRIPKELLRCIDFNVNKATQNFRLINSCKLGTTRKLTYESGAFFKYTNSKEENIFLTSLVSYCEKLRPLPSILDGAKATNIKINDEFDMGDKLKTEALKIAEENGFLEGFSIRDIHHNMIRFDRIRPSFCKICQEKHHKDNTLVLFINSIDNNEDTVKKAVFAKCRHHSEVKIVGLLTPASTEDVKSKPRAKYERALKYKPEASDIEELRGVSRYDDPVIRDFPLCRTLFVKAQMKMGKTNTLKRFIHDKFPLNGLYEPVIRVVSFRRSFASEFFSKFKEEGFELYTDLDGTITHPRVVIQMESLFRLMVTPDPIDLLILDESESIFEQIDSGLHGQFALSFAVFHWMLRTAKHVICMDALLGNRTYNIVKTLRGLDDARFEHNTHQKAADDKYYFTSELKVWLAEVFDAIEADENIVINSSSLVELETIKQLIEDRFPDIEIGMYTSKTEMSLKKKHFGDVNTYWSGYRVLMTTPTVSAGVSFEREHYDKVFGYFIDCSCGTETCIQMMGRVRNISSKSYYICINDNMRASLPINRDEIRRLLLTRHASILGDMDTNHLSFYYDSNGDIIFHNSDYYTIWLENTVVRNANRRDFYGRLINYIRESGASVEYLQESSEEEAALAYNELMAEHDCAHDSVKDIDAFVIATAEDIEDDEAYAITTAIQNQKDVSVDDVNKLKKYRLRKYYRYDKPEMIPQFVRRYNTHHLKLQFKYLDTIAGVRDDPALLEAKLRAIKEEESITKDTLQDYVDNRYIENRAGPIKALLSKVKNSILDSIDISNRYMYDKISLSCKILSVCGWSTPFDSKNIDEVALFYNIKAGIDDLIKAGPKVVFLFEVNWAISAKLVNDIESLPKLIRAINKVMDRIYGINIKKKPKSTMDITEKYFLLQNQEIGIDGDRARAF